MSSSQISKTKDPLSKKRKLHTVDGGSKSKRLRQDGLQRKSKIRSTVLPVEAQLAQMAEIASQMADNQGIFHEQDPSFEQNGYRSDASRWRVSKPMGGRMLDIDPILVEDEKYVILTYNTSIQVFSVADSHLIRRIPIKAANAKPERSLRPATITSTRLAASNPDTLWVACSDGTIHYVNWKGDGKRKEFTTKSGTAHSIAMGPSILGNELQDVILVMESKNPDTIEIAAYQLQTDMSINVATISTARMPVTGIPVLETKRDGSVLVAAIGGRLIVGSKTTQRLEQLQHLKYDLFLLDAPDIIASLDVQTNLRPRSTKKQRAELVDEPVVNVVVGGASGAIYRYHDILVRLKSLSAKVISKEQLVPQKHHWHRKAVHAVKWSADGNYMISGGSENVLVTWQLDTSKMDFLPHLAGSVENIVVSNSGGSYVLHLDDNSTVIFSTAEMKPTTYICGIQSAATQVLASKDSLAQRIWSTAAKVKRPIPAVISSSDGSKLHVCAGNGQQATMAGSFSAPFLQTFDLGSFTSSSKQPLARTQQTYANLTHKGRPVDEPQISHLAISKDGMWLASVDEWEPSATNSENHIDHTQDRLITDYRETHLKFWKVDDGGDGLSLVSRVDNPHRSSSPEVILHMMPSPIQNCFATIGSDGAIRLWRLKQVQGGASIRTDTAGRSTHSWACSQTIPIGDMEAQAQAQFHTPAQTAYAKTPKSANGVLQSLPSSSLVYGRLAFSEDGSTLFAAFGTGRYGAVSIIEMTTGTVVKTVDGLWKGELRGLGVMSPYLVILSDELRVYDVVTDELRYGSIIPETPQVKDLLQLAVDNKSGHFAVAFAVDHGSSIGIFHPEQPEPVLIQSIPHMTVSLLSSPSTSGFVALDDAAQVWTFSEGSSNTSLAAAQPLEDIHLHETNGDAEESHPLALSVQESADMAVDEAYSASEDEGDDVDMLDEEDHHAVRIPQQHLADIFNASTTFSASSVEDMFYKVTGLLNIKPVSVN